MFVVGALFALVTLGVVVPCLIDVAVAPEFEVRRLAKQWWVLLIVFGSLFGAAAWLMFGRPQTHVRAGTHWSYRDRSPYLTPEEALRHHPAGRAMEQSLGIPQGRTLSAARPIGPDDDMAFIEELARRIDRGDQADSDA
jgi:hypothetical protein